MREQVKFLQIINNDEFLSSAIEKERGVQAIFSFTSGKHMSNNYAPFL